MLACGTWLCLHHHDWLHTPRTAAVHHLMVRGLILGPAVLSLMCACACLPRFVGLQCASITWIIAGHKLRRPQAVVRLLDYSINQPVPLFESWC